MRGNANSAQPTSVNIDMSGGRYRQHVALARIVAERGRPADVAALANAFSDVKRLRVPNCDVCTFVVRMSASLLMMNEPATLGDADETRRATQLALEVLETSTLRTKNPAAWLFAVKELVNMQHHKESAFASAVSRSLAASQNPAIRGMATIDKVVQRRFIDPPVNNFRGFMPTY